MWRPEGRKARALRLLWLCFFGLRLDLGGLELELERFAILLSAETMRAVPTIGATAASTPANLIRVELEVAGNLEVGDVGVGAASTATSAAMRTSINVSGSRLDASSRIAVMLASRSSTGVSAMGFSFREVRDTADAAARSCWCYIPRRSRRRSRRRTPHTETGDSGRPNGSMKSVTGPVCAGNVPSSTSME